MFFPTAGIECNPFLLPLVAFGISMCTSMAGISGAFLLLPFQMSVLGYVNPSVSATNQFFNIVAIPSGLLRFIREKRMVFPLVYVIAIGTCPGVFLGALIRITWLPNPEAFKLFAGALLLYIGARLAYDMVRGKGKTPKTDEIRKTHKIANSNTAAEKFPQVQLVLWSQREVVYTYNDVTYRFSVPLMVLLTLIVGILGGIYGIGGGAIIAPFLVSFLGLPVHTIAGASLFATFLTSVLAVIFYMLIAPFYPELAIMPDFGIGLLLGIGGMAGMYCGARLQKHIPATGIKALLVCIMLGIAVKYLL